MSLLWRKKLPPPTPHGVAVANHTHTHRQQHHGRGNHLWLLLSLVAWCFPSPLTRQQPLPAYTSPSVESKQSIHLFGFFLNEYKEPKATLEVVKSVAAFTPGSPMYVVGTGGFHYEPLAERFDAMHFVYDETNVDLTSGTVAMDAIDLYLRRVKEAALYCNCSYLVLMEPDVLLRGPIREAPAHDAGGVADHGFQSGI